MYGTGKIWQSYMAKGISDFFQSNNVKIIGFCDKKYDSGMIVDEDIRQKIIHINTINGVKFDCILVTSVKYYSEIRKYLIDNYQVSGEKILLLDIFLANIMYESSWFKNKNGIEIGGPSYVFKSIYEWCNLCDDVNFSVDTVWWSKKCSDYIVDNKVLGNVYIEDAVNMAGVLSENYDFLLSSNNLEHIANPLKALMEFRRVLKKNGVLVLIVPDKRFTFDHNRKYTLKEHIFDDYNADVGEDDLTHLSEITLYHDYDMDVACGGREKFLERAMNNVSNRCLHHHVFNFDVLEDILEYIGFNIVKKMEAFCNLCIIAKK